MVATTDWLDDTPAPQPSYRYLLCDLLTDRLMASLPMAGVSFDRHISRTGSLSGKIIATTREQVDLARLVHAYAGRAALYVLRDGQLWWGGIPWTVQATQGARGAVSVDLQAATFDSYAAHRVLRESLSFQQVDQATIMATLWDHLQADPRGNIGVDTSQVEATGVLRDRDYAAADLSTYGKLIEQLGDVDDGAEHTVDVYLDGNGDRVKRLRVAQRLGSPDPSAVFTRARKAGGRVVTWGDTSDAVDSGTTFQTRGDSPSGNVGEDKEPLLSSVLYADELLANGWPLLDLVEDHTGVKRADTLDEYAAGLRDMYAGPLRERSYTVQVGQSGWSPNRLGDTVRLKLSDIWHHPAVDLDVRPVACKVTAADRGGNESIDLTFGE